MMTNLGSGNYYFGHNDIETEGVWVWSDGHASEYTHWKSDEPNDLSNSDCAYFYWPGYGGEWDDGICGNTQPFICSIH